MKKTIYYIDESQGDIIQFATRMNSTPNFKVEYLQITDGMSLNDVIEHLSEQHFECLVVDFFLKQEAKVNFLGDDIVAAYLNRYPNFPILMLSNKDDGAIEQSEDINVAIIRSKREYRENPGLFITRLEKMIENYQDSITQKSDELENLKLKEAQGTINANEEERLIELDAFLDESLDSSNKVPNSARMSSNAKRLDSLIQKADIIIRKMTDGEEV
ncbi:MAG: hypothetical protein ACM3KF_02195 [Acidobacteriota bacterium]